MVYAKVRELPESLQSALREVGYARPDISVEAKEQASRLGMSGDGLRAFCAVVNLASGERTLEWGSWGGANMFCPTNAVDLDRSAYPIPEGFAVVNGHVGGARPVYAYVTVRPDAIAPLLPPAAELTEREGWILYLWNSLNAYGRRNELERRGPKHAPTEAEIASLVSRGLLKRNKAGAVSITTEGKNAYSQANGRAKHG